MKNLWQFSGTNFQYYNFKITFKIFIKCLINQNSINCNSLLPISLFLKAEVKKELWQIIRNISYRQKCAENFPHPLSTRTRVQLLVHYPVFLPLYDIQTAKSSHNIAYTLSHSDRIQFLELACNSLQFDMAEAHSWVCSPHQTTATGIRQLTLITEAREKESLGLLVVFYR
jgi:hypothetical protein